MSIPIKPFWEYVNKTDTCWFWLYKTQGGYGMYGKHRAHRHAYKMLVGQIPTGMMLHHKCKNKLCVNPDHLEPVTHETHPDSHANVLKTKTHCAHGHEYKEGSFYVCRNYRGSVYRVCKVCYSKSYRRKVYHENQSGTA